jgi:hypothetical protein
MGDDSRGFLADVREIIEARVKEQLDRHLRVDPNTDPRSVIDIQMEQERELLGCMETKFADNGDDNLADMARALRDEWLPELRRKLWRF